MEPTCGEMYLPMAAETMPPSWLFESQVKDLVTEPSLLWFRFFFVPSLNSFEQALVPRVTKNRYGLNNTYQGWRCEGRNLVYAYPEYTGYRIPTLLAS